jgi:hypothetical protein
MQAIALRAYAGRGPISPRLIPAINSPGSIKINVLTFHPLIVNNRVYRFVFIDTDRADSREF